MPDIAIVTENVSGSNRIIIRDGEIAVIIRLHFYDKEFSQGSVELQEGKNGVVLKASEDTLEKIKGFLVKRGNIAELAWSILQNEYRTLDHIEAKVEKLQNASIHSYSREILVNIVKIKKNLFYMHRDYIRLRNIVETAIDDNYHRREMRRILRDINEMIEVVEYLVDATTTAIQLMQNTLSSKMNEVMKILTVIATIMMPLTLITGIYGMNFRNMPELYWSYGYYYSLTLMAIIALVMVIYFKRKGII